MPEFQYAPRDFESPDALMRTLDRMDTTQVNSHGYNQKFFHAVTNQGKFESDAWFDVAFDIGAKDSLRSFLERLSEWQTRSGSSKVFLPDIVEDAARSNAWVADALQASGFVAAPEAPGRQVSEHTAELSLR